MIHCNTGFVLHYNILLPRNPPVLFRFRIYTTYLTWYINADI